MRTSELSQRLVTSAATFYKAFAIAFSDDSHLDCVYNLFTNGDGTDDDDGVALLQQAFGEERLQGGVDGFFRVGMVERRHDGRDAPIQGQRVGHSPVLTDG